MRLRPASRPALRRPDGFTLLIIAAALLSVALTLARQVEYGVGLPWDAVNYIGVARNLLDGAGFVEITGRDYTYWPPLYPILLAAASLPGLDPQDVAGPLNAAAFGLAVVVSGAWLRKTAQSRFLAAWGILAVALSLPMAWAASAALVTMPFSALILLALVAIERFLHTQRRRDLMLAALFSALAWAMHYTGIALVVFTAALLALQPGAALSIKAKRIGAYAAAAALPISLWMTRNLLLTGAAGGGERGFETESFLALLSDVVAWASQWIFVNLFVDSRYFGTNQWPAATALTGIALLSLALGVAYLLVRAARNKEFSARWSPVYVFAGFTLAYALALTLALALGSASGRYDRYLLPAHIPLLLGVVSLLDKWFAAARSRGTPYARRLLIGTAAGLCGWFALAAALHPLAMREANAYGIGTYDAIRDSETLRYASENLIGSETYSNDAWAVYAWTRGRLAPEWELALDNDGAFIIWLYDAPPSYYFLSRGMGDLMPPDLRARPGLETLAELADGAVFRINTARDPRIALQAAYDSLAAREPDARAAYDIHLDGRTLTYVRAPCSREETAPRFFLHVVPVDRERLPDDRKRYGFDNLDFSFRDVGVRFDEICMAAASLPSYPIAEIKTGQFAGGRRLWEARFPFP